MPTKSHQSVRVRNLPLDTGHNAFKELATTLCSTKKSGSSSALFSVPPTSLAIDSGEKVGTITFPTEQIKENALPHQTLNWRFDDGFDGLTVLQTPESADVDICSVHGLNGNAFDTFFSGNKMWLRDHLPLTLGFENARTMTFGYNSSLVDRMNLAGLQDWADNLLESVGSRRTTREEQCRPLIFVCHSLGGIVAREAVIRLSERSGQYDGISLKCCGFLFLSTPHHGSKLADHNRSYDRAADIIGIRSDIVNILRTASEVSAESRRKFENLAEKPPFYCLCEGKKTGPTPVAKTIVTQESAGLAGQTATLMEGCDHRTVARFENKFEPGYRIIVDRLGKVKQALKGLETQTSLSPDNIPGRAPMTAPQYPPDKLFYEGYDLPRRNNLRGRKAQYEELSELLRKCQNEEGAIIVSGIGGIGKTELLLAVAYQHKSKTNVFVIRPHECATLEDAYVEMANQIGHDCLASRWPIHERQEIWSGYSPSKRVEAFKAWLGMPENRKSLFIIDDIDGFEHVDSIKTALPCEVDNVIFSTRKPGLRMQRVKTYFPLRLSPMKLWETVDLMEHFLDKSGYNDDGSVLERKELELIARVVYGHPTSALNAVSYVVELILPETDDSPGTVFIERLINTDYEARRVFLEYEPDFETSILQTFEQSRKRLNDPDGVVWRLMTFIAFLQTDENPVVDFRRFFGRGDELHDIQAELPDYDILSSPPSGVSLSKLEGVAFGYRHSTRGPLLFHPIWLECVRQLIGHEARIRTARQVLLVCRRALSTLSGSVEDERQRTIYVAHAFKALEVCRSFRIEVADLDFPEEAKPWLTATRNEAAVHIKPGLKVNRTW